MSDTTTYSATSTTSINDDQWHYITGTYDGDALKIYVDGDLEDTNTDPSGDLPTTSGNLRVGADYNSTAANFFDGIIDEVHISDTARDACWIETEYNNQNSPATAYAVGAEESLNYSYFKEIFIDKGQIGSSCGLALTDFPFLFTLTGTDFQQIEDKVDSNGYDIIFVDALGHQLDHEIEIYDETADELVVWVRIPALPPDVDTTIFMYYGNEAVTSATENPSGVWKNNFKGVWHLKETDIDGGSEDIKDSTSNANDGTTAQMDANDQISGKIDGSFNFDGSDDFVDVTDDDSLDVTNITLSAWVKSSTTGRYIIAKNGSVGTGTSLTVVQHTSYTPPAHVLTIPFVLGSQPTVGNLLIAFCQNLTGSSPISAPDGTWTQIEEQTNYNVHLTVWWKAVAEGPLAAVIDCLASNH